jgi:hypothetical protein
MRWPCDSHRLRLLIVRVLPHNPLAYIMEWISLEIIPLFLVSEREKAKRG